ncbi:homoserine dehydrogenase [Falsibacillus pallidus]|uniref:Homoserine dehydrogenase n=1 Tax=Falsibacillus pallidus TaxID=493781 RepID=A0A370G5R3_9BACI|nr:homoserine dehydrogenase [Falsibacillus pallidus]RDI37914.1 homoserine dehydrogenase [Falsibacillus pallidus]
MPINVVLLGFGTVGESVYRTIASHQDGLRNILGTDIVVKGVLVKDARKSRNIASDVLVTTDFKKLLELPNIHAAIEAIVGVEPAFTYGKQFLNAGIPVITANKEMAAHKGGKLRKEAEANGTEFHFEAAVAGGIPIIAVLKQLLHANRISKIEGILNGTSNFILSTMREEGISFAEALERAQRNGYAEADPSNDILGKDSFYKLMILSELVFGKQPEWDEVDCTGINELVLNDLEEAGAGGKRIKLVASIGKDENGNLTAAVEPHSLDENHPLYHVEGVDNGIVVHTDLLGRLFLQGPGAGGPPTASAILEDLTQHFRSKPYQKPFVETSKVRAIR